MKHLLILSTALLYLLMTLGAGVCTSTEEDNLQVTYTLFNNKRSFSDSCLKSSSSKQCLEQSLKNALSITTWEPGVKLTGISGIQIALCTFWDLMDLNTNVSLPFETLTLNFPCVKGMYLKNRSILI